MKLYKIFIFILAMSLCLAVSARAGESPKYLFRIPQYPGTELFHSYPIMAELNVLQPPFATILKVYKTKDGSPINKEEVINFYNEHFKKKGWKEGIFKRIGDEPYLGLRINISENLDGALVQLSGEFRLWVAPKDGMYTIFVKQWRISHPKQQTINQIVDITRILEKTAEELNYRFQKEGITDSRWERYYENEYLIERTLFSLFDKDVEFRSKSCFDQTGIIHGSILIYGDHEIANTEAKQLKSFHGIPAMILENIVVIIRGASGKEKEVVKKIVERIKKLEK